MPPLFTVDVERSMARQHLGTANARHVEAWMWELKAKGSSIGALVHESPAQFDQLVNEAVLVARAVPFRESEALAQRWRL